jgi:hypothetical protein
VVLQQGEEEMNRSNKYDLRTAVLALLKGEGDSTAAYNADSKPDAKLAAETTGL